jgi:biopolymer transport protein ExbD
MSKRRRPLPTPSTSPFEQIDVSPLIDVSFLLLIFFLVTSTIQKAETELSTKLPGDPDLGTPVDTLTVDIDAAADGTILFNGATVATDPNQRSLPALVKQLEQAKELAASSTTPILASINIDDDASQQRFADVLNALSAAKIENIAIQ